MTCSNTKSGSVTLGPTPVWSERSTSTWVFHPVSAPMQSADVAGSIRPNIDMGQDSGNAKARAALRMSDDGLTWDTPVAIGTLTATADGTSYATSYADVKSTLEGKRLVQFGIECTNETGTDLELARVSIQLDFQS